MDEGSRRRDKVNSKFDGRMIREAVKRREFLEAQSEFPSYETTATTMAHEVFKQTSGDAVVQIPLGHNWQQQ